MATHSSILAGRITWSEEPAGCSPQGHKRVGHNLRGLAGTHSFDDLIQNYATLTFM